MPILKGIHNDITLLKECLIVCHQMANYVENKNEVKWGFSNVTLQYIYSEFFVNTQIKTTKSLQCVLN